MKKVTLSRNGRRIGRPRISNEGRKLNVRISEDLAARVDQYAVANFCSFGDALRELLDKGATPDIARDIAEARRKIFGAR